jgi:Ca2+-binding EF-hand superfamily protein
MASSAYFDEATLIGLFQEADQDGNGTIDHAEFQQLLERALPGLLPGQYSMLMAEADEDTDGVIDYSEFVIVATELMEAFASKREAQVIYQPRDECEYRKQIVGRRRRDKI